jgi:hypothetical protein
MADIVWLGDGQAGTRVSVTLTSEEVGALGEDRTAGLQNLLTPAPPVVEKPVPVAPKAKPKKTTKKAAPKKG